jgi:hypothetical protein
MHERIKQTLSEEVIAGLKVGILKSPFYQGNIKAGPEIMFDTLACGDAVINKAGMLQKDIQKVRFPFPGKKTVIKDRVPGVDMESYAILRSCSILSDPYKTIPLVIKAISDFTESKDQIHNRGLAASNSAICAKLLCENYLNFD